MNFISKLFGNKTETSNPAKAVFEPQTAVLESPALVIPPAELFIENEMPKTETRNVEESKNKIIAFLNRDFHAIGIAEGYEYHSNESFESGKKKIRAEFQLLVDQAIEEKKGRILKLRNLLVDISRISEDVKFQLENTIEEIKASVESLQQQKELSVENEGWVMNALHPYQQGFVQGLNNYIAGEELLNSINNF